MIYGGPAEWAGEVITLYPFLNAIHMEDVHTPWELAHLIFFLQLYQANGAAYLLLLQLFKPGGHWQKLLRRPTTVATVLNLCRLKPPAAAAHE